MYQVIDGILTITVNDWIATGLTKNQFENDSKRGHLKILRRSTRGNTQIDATSIMRPDRRRAIERTFGKINDKRDKAVFYVEIDVKARDFFISYRKPDGSRLDDVKIKEYVNRASIFEGIKRGLQKQIEARAASGRRLTMKKFWKAATDWYLDQLKDYPCAPIGNSRSLERAFKDYLNNGYLSVLHKGLGNDSTRKVSAAAAKLLLALYRSHDNPFVEEVHRLYNEFIRGSIELHDKETGEIFYPEHFRHKNKPLAISVATVRNYLKDVISHTATYADRQGNFDYVTKKRPQHHRKLGKYSLSKISMDDAVLSRKSVRGWVAKYLAVDVVSGYWFRPAYVVGKPSHDTVYEAFRNMFCELSMLGLPIPGELEVEHHLMKDLDWLKDVFPYVRFCSSPTEKRAEHKIKALKYGTSKRECHTRGRWYARSDAYRSVRNKVAGDFIEPQWQPQAIVADDLSDIDKHNNELHPLQKTYPGMTRRDVFLSNVNPGLAPIDPSYLYKFIGNETETTIYNNDYCPVGGTEFEIVDFAVLKRLKTDNYKVTAYWLPDDDGTIDKVYLYQDDSYIGEAVNRKITSYNENKIERTAEDEEKMLHQMKRIAKFDKFIKEERAAIPHIGKTAGTQALVETTDVVLAETTQPAIDDVPEYVETDWAAKAIEQI